ncbi:MAG: chorismate synthase [Chthonomonadetes bacterium]|nr:chorismate synthase [Chthonomonadetes bacterium]
MGNTFGHLFRITTFGESHGGAVGVVIDGCPPRVPITVEEIQFELDRRRPGQSKLVTQRRESDRVHILSGVFEGQTLGTPICVLVWNEDARPEAYTDFKDLYRPSHADYTYDARYGIRDWRGGGRSSARETVGRVAAGAIAKKILRQLGVEIVGWVEKIHTLRAQIDPNTVTLEQVEANPVRCPDPQVAEAMARAIEQARKEGDSLGGVVGCVARGVPAGWGDPVFDKLDADLAKAMLSIPAAKGFEVGSGFAGTDLTGSQHNDPFYVDADGRVRTRTNHSGGIQGGISNGENILIRVAFKPTATIMMPQETVDIHHQPAVLKAKGRHDPCVLPRAVPIVEAMMALVLVDHYLRTRAQCGGEP